jgi:hypothetical protein
VAVDWRDPLKSLVDPLAEKLRDPNLHPQLREGLESEVARLNRFRRPNPPSPPVPAPRLPPDLPQ